jgi:hypothetical protein
MKEKSEFFSILMADINKALRVKTQVDIDKKLLL